MTRGKSHGLVVDASYILSLLLPDETTAPDTSLPMFSPSLLRYEIANGLRSATLSQRITKQLALTLYKEFQSFPITYQEPDYLESLSQAITHKLSVYDASYLVLAQSLGFPIKSFDQVLVKLTQKHR